MARNPAPAVRPDDGPATDDPRVNGDYVRRIASDGARRGVLVVGVAHDHPASVYRVRALAAAAAPDVLALEMPPLALPLLRRRARREGGPAGGEMSAAIRAAPGARCVGIDGIDGRFLLALADALREADGGVGTVGRVAERTGRIACRTAACWLRGAVGAGGADPLPSTTYGCPDDPAAQADHERSHIDRCGSLLGAVEPSPAARSVDAAREACMARRIAALRAEGSVVAVVGWAHLDGVADRLGREDGRSPVG